MKTRNILIALAVIIVIVAAAFAFRPKESHEGWLSYTDPDSGAIVSYPESFGTTYIHPIDWPPRVRVLDERFSCAQAGTETARAGKTEQRKINERDYCVTTLTEGAAGSVYTQYAYGFAKGKKTTMLTFTTRMPQCLNYDEPKRSECQSERTSFNLDALIDGVAQAIDYP